MCLGLGLLRRPAHPYLSTFFEVQPLREPDSKVYEKIESSGSNRDGVHSCGVGGCTETFSRLDRAVLHIRTVHNREQVKLDCKCSAVKDPQVLCSLCGEWQSGSHHDWKLQPEAHKCQETFEKDFYESHAEFYQRKILKVRMRMIEWQ